MSNTEIVALTLDMVFSKFNIWRKNRANPKEKIPNSLWNDVLSLIGRYSAVDIVRTLGLNHSQLKKRLHESAQHDLKALGFSNTFSEVENNLEKNIGSKIQAETKPTQIQYETGPIEIKRSDGTTLLIQNMPQNKIHDLIQSFIGE